MSIVHRQHDGDDPHLAEGGIAHVVTKQRTKLLENETLHTQVPMAGTLIISSHDTRLQGGSDAARRTSRSTRQRVPDRQSRRGGTS